MVRVFAGTWAWYRANANLAATISGLTDEVQRFDDACIRMRGDLSRDVESGNS